MDTAMAKARQCPHVEVCEQEGLVWVYPAFDEKPANGPFCLGLDKLSDHTIVVRQVDAQATLHATLENALDVPHTAFLHRGLFRSGKPNQVRVRITRTSLGVEAEYMGEPRPSGIIGRVLSPGGGIVEHWDRFVLPSIAQVEYRLGVESHFVVTALCTPVSDFHTRLTAVAAFRTPLPAPLLKPLLTAVGLRIFAQDARILRAQTDNIRNFGGEQFMSSELDMLGPHIWWLLRQAERGDITESAFEKELTFLA
jgi:phenylpropionate dioxygenase-like ring-hydroxylating dioxygenase large terminal subunit